MTYLKNFRELTRRYKRDEKGTMAVAYACSLLTLVIAIGAGYDFAQLSNADHKSQNIADGAALTAAVFVQNHNRMPLTDDEGYLHDQYYDARAEGHTFPNTVHKTGDGAPKVKVEYDFVNRQAIATVTGKTSPAFLKVTGHKNLEFEERAVVKFSEKRAGDSASVFLVLDNSGSMNWDDSSGNPRLTSLKVTVKDFMDQLTTITDDIPTSEPRVLRTAMIPFSNRCDHLGDMCDDILNSGIVKTTQAGRRFGVVSDDEVDKMREMAGTNPVGALSRARNWMRKEEDKHSAEVSSKSPDTYDEEEFKVLKYVILMSDGQNSTGWNDCEESTLPSSYVTERSLGATGSARSFPGVERYRRKSDGQIATPVGSFSGQDWQDDSSDTTYWSSCEFKAVNYNAQTLSRCEDLKEEGVEVYTIGFGLEPGTYDNNWGGSSTISKADSDAAYDLLEGCATSLQHFVKAEDASKLSEAFSNIGRDIVEDVIRIVN